MNECNPVSTVITLDKVLRYQGDGCWTYIFSCSGQN
uniref:Uncharacterized protein n=1 Tax=Lepeophtheirus salmonis TaxID=72036 RepID=A0A0K2UI27_LEPSM